MAIIFGIVICCCLNLILTMDFDNLRNKSKTDLIKIIQEKDSHLEMLIERIEKLEISIAEKSYCDKIIDLERDLYGQQQYSRRETLEFVGIPKEIGIKDIEKKVVELCNHAGVQVTERSFHAVHRLRNSDTVIAKFVHRKDAMNVLYNKKKLRETDTSF